MAVVVLMAMGMGMPVRMGVCFAVMGMAMVMFVCMFMVMVMFVSVQFYLHWDLLVCISLSFQAAKEHLPYYHNYFSRQGKKKKTQFHSRFCFLLAPAAANGMVTDTVNKKNRNCN